jgi:hypothetical protein
MHDPAFEAVLKEFKEAAPKPTPADALVIIQSVSIGVAVPGQPGQYSEVINIVDGIGEPIMSLDNESRDVHTFPIENEWLSGTATIVVNRPKGTLSCDATEVKVKSPFAEQGFLVSGYDVGCVGMGDHDGDTLVRRKKKKNRNQRYVTSSALMTLLNRAEQRVYSTGRVAK